MTLAEVKEHLRLTGDEFDGNLTLLLEAAVSGAETITGLTLRESTYRVTELNDRVVSTGLMPIRAVTATVDGRPLEGVGISGSHVILPDDVEAVTAELEVKTGFDEFPADLKAAILLMTARFFEFPSDPVENLPKASTNILKNYTRWDR